MPAHRMTLVAYPIKDELGGGFRGALRDHATTTDHKSEVLGTLDTARYWAKAKAHELMDGEFYRLAPLRRTGEYEANLWA